MRGTRIQNIVDELGGEKIDIVEWSNDVREFISNALSPAKPSDTMLIEEGEVHTAVVVVPDRQLSLAIGKEGQNARLAAKLTGWRIDIKSETEAATEGLNEIKRQQMQLAKTRTLEAKATTPPPDDLLSRAEWLLRQKDKNAMTLDQVAKLLADSEAASAEKEMLEPVAHEGTKGAEATIEEPKVAEVAAESKAAETEPVETLAAPAVSPLLVPETEKVLTDETEAVTPELLEAAYDSYPVEDEETTEESGKTSKKAKAKKTQKKRDLVYDEQLGQVVAIKKRKRGPTNWEDSGDY